MVVTRSSFLARYKKFQTQDPEIVDFALEQSKEFVVTSLWGQRRDTGVVRRDDASAVVGNHWSRSEKARKDLRRGVYRCQGRRLAACRHSRRSGGSNQRYANCRTNGKDGGGLWIARHYRRRRYRRGGRPSQRIPPATWRCRRIGR